MTKSIALAAAVVLGCQAYAGTTAAPAKTVTEVAKESCITGDLGADVTNAYFFHGIRQEDNGFIIQPYADLYFQVYKGSGFLSTLSVDLGIWNSFHSNRGVSSTTTSNWYEFDFTAGLTATFAEKWSLGAKFLSYASPGDYFDTSYALGVKLGYDDKDLLGAFSLQPYVYVEFELDGKSGNGPDEGIYYEAGLTPSFDLGPVSIGLPLRVGLGSNGYYAGDEGFGYFSAGVSATYQLAFVPECLGEWSVTASSTYMYLGDGTEPSNGGGDVNQWIFAGGLKVAF